MLTGYNYMFAGYNYMFSGYNYMFAGYNYMFSGYNYIFTVCCHYRPRTCAFFNNLRLLSTQSYININIPVPSYPENKQRWWLVGKLKVPKMQIYHCLSFCLFLYWPMHCLSFSKLRFWLPIWYFQDFFTIQWSKDRGQIMIYTALYKKAKDCGTRTPTKT